MPSQCTFTLGNEEQLYHAGQDNVDGVVTLITTTEKQVKQIKVRFKGVIVCSFVQTFDDDNDHDDEMSGGPVFSLEYFSRDKLVKIENSVHEAGVLPAGTYTWPFSFPVPEECPTSMEGTEGHIRYQLSLKIYNETKYKNIFIKPVTIIKPDDLNLRNDCILPLEIDRHSTFCCGLFKSDSHLNLSTNFGGYAPGQWLRYTAEMFNKTVTQATDYEVQFTREIIYLSKKPGKCKRVENTIIYSRVETDNFLPFQMIMHAFYIPSTPPTTKTKYITIQYYLKVTLQVKCCNPKTNPKLIAKLVVPIGTVPLKESLLPRLQRLLCRRMENRYIISPSYYDRPECLDTTYIDKHIEEINRDDNFMPVYPTFRNIFGLR